MSRLGIFMADGCEEIEGLTVVDLVRRAGIGIEMISVSGHSAVTGSHNIKFETDVDKMDADYDTYDGIVLPGGMPGTVHLLEDETVHRVIKKFEQEQKLIAAICAAPSVLGAARTLEGRRATCYPGVEDKLFGAICLTDPVVRDGNIITSRGLGTAIDFAAAIVEYLTDAQTAQELKESIVYK